MDQKRGPFMRVVKDFNTNSLQTPIVTIVMGCSKDAYQVISIKVKPEKTRETVAVIEKIWDTAYSEYVYEYQLLKDKIDNCYKEEGRLSRLYKLFAGIAIFISCLGLYGLISFMTVQRVKEVGIRKVLGASVGSIMYLFSREFAASIGISFLISTPLAYYFIQRWLEGFAFHIRPGIGLFLIAIAGSMLIAWLTVGYRAFRAAIANPVSSIGNE